MNLITLKIYWDIIKLGLIGLVTFLLIGMFLSIPLCLLWNWSNVNIDRKANEAFDKIMSEFKA